jgi:hypothetical protein
MISYYGYTISPNQLETGEGFLICRNVPIARTGTQEYLGNEIGMETSEVVEVWRTEEEVFDPAAMASFEGKPATNDHPTELVTPDNVARYEMGHIQNVRRGSGEFSDFLLGDLHIHDVELIKAIRNGKRQISCGYECEYIEKDGKIYQTHIRGNHVAVVDEGRAGAKAAIMDSIKKQPEKAERNKRMSKKSTLLKLFGIAASGKSEEEVAKLALDTADALEEQIEEKVEEKAELPAGDAEPELSAKEQAQVEEKVADEITLADLAGKLDQLINLLSPKAEPEKAEVEVETKEDIDSALKELGDETGEESVVVSAEEMDEEATEEVAASEEVKTDACGAKDTALDAAMQRAILKTVRDAVAGIKDETERKSVTDAVLKAVRTKKSDLEGILERQYTPKTNDSNEDIQARYNAMNPHKH